MLTDEVKINVHAGKGGNGLVTFSSIKMELGPTGGRGGNGGNVYFEGVSDLSALNKYRHKKEYFAENGQDGKSERSEGRNGKDITLRFPVGSFFRDLSSGKEFDITEIGEKRLIAKGGIGGRGNFSFRSSINTSPQEAEAGKSGEEYSFYVELRLIADVGLVGLPSAGKSSLLNELTKAEAKVGEYHFTTLEPNLGAFEGIIIADIPGLIEGASKGRGLGVKFLRHIARTKLLFHCLAADADDLLGDYGVIRKELAAFDKKLSEKAEVIILTKTDLVSEKDLLAKIKKLKKLKREILPASIHDWEKLEQVKKYLIESVKK